MPIPASFDGIHYNRFLREICRQRAARRYLEIGVASGETLAGIEVEEAVGVDPDFTLSFDPTRNKRQLRLYRVTSDAFFRDYAETGFDACFLDGMHLFEYLLRDFYNAESRSRENGLIMMHDCMPLTEQMISRSVYHGAWTGDVWKTISILKKYRPDLKIVMADCHPTGLACISNLDPTSEVLKNNYLDIVREVSSAPNDLEALDRFYDAIEVTSAQDIIDGFNHSLYFRL